MSKASKRKRKALRLAEAGPLPQERVSLGSVRGYAPLSVTRLRRMADAISEQGGTPVFVCPRERVDAYHLPPNGKCPNCGTLVVVAAKERLANVKPEKDSRQGSAT